MSGNGTLPDENPVGSIGTSGETPVGPGAVDQSIVEEVPL